MSSDIFASTSTFILYTPKSVKRHSTACQCIRPRHRILLFLRAIKATHVAASEHGAGWCKVSRAIH